MRDPLVAIERVRQLLAGSLATRIDPRLSRWADAASQPTSFEAYRAFDEGLNAFFSPSDSGSVRTLSWLFRAASLDTTFTLPLIWALFALDDLDDSVRFDSVSRVLEVRRAQLPPLDRALLDAHLALRRRDYAASHEALRRAVTIAPNSEWLFKLGYVALLLHRYDEADSAFRALDPDAGWMREWSPYWERRTDAAYYLGRHDEELAIARREQVRFAQIMRRPEGRALAALGRDHDLLTLVDGDLSRSRGQLDSEALFRLVSAARVHGHLGLARALVSRARRMPVTIDMGDSMVTRARYEVLLLEAAEMWNEAVRSARRLLHVDSLIGRRDALPYMVMLQAALRQTQPIDTAGLEQRALSAAAHPRPSDALNQWRSETRLAVEAELAALHHDTLRTAALLRDAVDRGVWEYYWFSERAAFDGVRGAPALRNLVHTRH